MKTATIPSLRVDPVLRKAAEAVLSDGETLSGFVEQSIRESVERREVQRAFLTRGLAVRADVKRTGKTIPADKVIVKLEDMLSKAKGKHGR